MKSLKTDCGLLFIALIILGSSCQKETLNVDLQPGKWKVVKIRLQGDNFKRAQEDYFLNFSASSVSFNLDVNGCIADYSSPEEGQIQIENLICTEICCDSELAVNLMRTLPLMNSYYLKGNRLYFEGTGEIILKRD